MYLIIKRRSRHYRLIDCLFCLFSNLCLNIKERKKNFFVNKKNILSVINDGLCFFYSFFRSSSVFFLLNNHWKKTGQLLFVMILFLIYKWWLKKHDSNLVREQKKERKMFILVRKFMFYKWLQIISRPIPRKTSERNSS